MPLKKLILNGFKSFAERTVIDFGSGITGIVGPNGSGKSNITEAIRWVMGESSAKSLRGNNMQDVIFAGSEFRKAMNFAEVTLIFANRKRELRFDADEVAVTRRLLRSGNSEYLINKKSVRLKDIRALFLDSGISQNSMAIISQGRVDQILNSKPDQRREIFEEAGGVLHFKQQKELAQRQLEKTSDNLIRINDLVKELENRISPLQEQSSLAKQYQFQKRQLDQKLKTLLAFEIQDLNHSKSQIQKAAQANLKILSKLDQEVKDSQTKLTEQQDKSAALSRQKDNLQEKLNQLTSSIARLNTNWEMNQQAVQFDQETKAEYQNQMQEIEQRLKEADHRQKQLTADLQQAQKQKDDILKKRREYLPKETVSLEELNARLEKKRDNYIQILQDQTAINNQLVYLGQELGRNQKQDLQSNNQRDFQAAQEQLQQLQKKGQELRRQEKATGNQAEELQKQVHDLQNRIRAEQEHLQKQRQQFSSVQARQEALQRIQKRHDGYYFGVRNVLNHRYEFPGIIGALGELISFPAKLAVALSTALAGGVQDIVTLDREAARNAIQKLKKQHAGRATFLPLGSLRVRNIPRSTMVTLSSLQGFIGIASELVQIKGQEDISEAISYLLGNVIVMDDIDHAMAAHQRVGYYRIVTLDGDLISPGGSMTGGARNKNNNSPLHLLAEIQDLTQRKKQSQQKLEKTSQLLAKLQADSQTLTAQLAKQRQRFTQLQSDLRAAAVSYQAQEKEVKRLQAALHLQDLQNQERQQALNNLSQQIVQAKEKQKQLIAAKKSRQQELSSLQEQIAQVSQSNQDNQAQIAKIESQLAVFKSQIANLEKQLQLQKETIQGYQEQKSKLQTKLTALADKRSRQHQDNDDYSAQNKQLKHEKQLLVAQLKQVNYEKARFEGQISDLENIANRNYELRKDAANEREDLSVKITKIDEQMNTRLDRLSQDYSLSYEAVIEQSQLDNTPDNRQKLQKSVKLHQMSLADIGPVNLQAIEEYDKVKKRYDFLQGQQDDLLTARSNLEKSMSDLDDKVKKRFADTFNQIATSFSKLFPLVFGGGDAKLVLTQPDNLLTTGIEIIARPPGKKLEHLSLLSGGERSLTAITLLFAMLRVNPVPFCILDEVEAALDDVNVSRFAQFLRRFDLQTQFIVITHRRGTMEKADQLYGVVMQESGVSQVLSVSLNELKDEVQS